MSIIEATPPALDRQAQAPLLLWTISCWSSSGRRGQNCGGARVNEPHTGA
jgi:hypothetical protein